MVRKQVYLRQAQDRKLKALAAARGCTEAEVIRDAVDQLPDPGGSVRDQLRAAGLLATLPPDEGVVTGDELRQLEAELDAWFETLTEPIGLGQAILDEREESDF